MPVKSPYLKIVDDGEHIEIIFNNESMWLLKKDVVILPIENISLEDLSQWFIDQFKNDPAFLSSNKIEKMTVVVYNGPYLGAEANLTY